MVFILQWKDYFIRWDLAIEEKEQYGEGWWAKEKNRV